MTGRRAAALLVALAVPMLVAQTLRTSAARLYPRYDEVSYLALGRATGARGRPCPRQVGCYLAARCKEDNRPPLYQLLLAPFLDDTPSDFARAKLVELAMALLAGGDRGGGGPARVLAGGGRGLGGRCSA